MASKLFEWQKDSGSFMDHYEIQKDEENWESIGMETTYTWNDITEEAHTFRVRAVSTSNNYSNIIEWSFDVTNESIVIDKVTPDFTTLNDNNKTFEWSISGGEDNLHYFEIIKSKPFINNGIKDLFISNNGYIHFALIDSNDELIMWGNNNFGQCDIPYGFNTKNIRDISISTGCTAAIDSDGILWIWGRNINSFLSKLSLNDGFVNRNLQNVYVGYNGFTIVLDENRKIWYWGDDGSSSEDISNVLDNPEFINENIKDICISGGHNYGIIDQNDKLWIWGRDYNGAITNIPSGLNDIGVKKMVAYLYNGLFGMVGAIDLNNNLWLWGNYSGDIQIPTQFKTGGNVKDVKFHRDELYVVDMNNDLYRFSYKTSGLYDIPTDVNSENIIKLIDTSFDTNGTINSNGEICIWGDSPSIPTYTTETENIGINTTYNWINTESGNKIFKVRAIDTSGLESNTLEWNFDILPEVFDNRLYSVQLTPEQETTFSSGCSVYVDDIKKDTKIVTYGGINSDGNYLSFTAANGIFSSTPRRDRSWYIEIDFKIIDPSNFVVANVYRDWYGTDQLDYHIYYNNSNKTLSHYSITNNDYAPLVKNQLNLNTWHKLIIESRDDLNVYTGYDGGIVEHYYIDGNKELGNYAAKHNRDDYFHKKLTINVDKMIIGNILIKEEGITVFQSDCIEDINNPNILTDISGNNNNINISNPIWSEPETYVYFKNENYPNNIILSQEISNELEYISGWRLNNVVNENFSSETFSFMTPIQSYVDNENYNYSLDTINYISEPSSLKLETLYGFSIDSALNNNTVSYMEFYIKLEDIIEKGARIEICDRRFFLDFADGKLKVLKNGTSTESALFNLIVNSNLSNNTWYKIRCIITGLCVFTSVDDSEFEGNGVSWQKFIGNIEEFNIAYAWYNIPHSITNIDNLKFADIIKNGTINITI